MKIFALILTLLLPLNILRADCSPSFCEEDSSSYEEALSSPGEEDPSSCEARGPYDTGPFFMENIPVLFENCWTLDVRVAYYAPNSKAVRDVYSGSWIDFQVEASKRIYENVDLWFGVSWAGKQHGHTEPLRYGFKDKTKMFILPVSIGLNWIYPILPCTEVYVGAGVCYSFLEIRNHFREDDSYYDDSYLSYSFSAPYKHNIHKTGVGGIFKVGLHYTMSSSTFFDFFADYYLQRFHLSHPRHGEKMNTIRGRYVDCSGFKIGGGLGVYF